MKLSASKNYGRFVGFLIVVVLFFSSCGYQDVSVSNAQNVHFKKISKEGVQVDFDMKIRNPNGFAIKVKKSKFDISVNKAKLGNAHLSKKIVLPAHSNKTYHLSIVADGSQLGKAAIPALLGLITKGGLPLEINGYVKGGAFLVFSKKVPVHYKNVVSVFGKWH